MVFSIYSVSTGGTALWTETQTVTVTKGVFNVLLGNINPIADTVFCNPNRWLGVKVGTDPEMKGDSNTALPGVTESDVNAEYNLMPNYFAFTSALASDRWPILHSATSPPALRGEGRNRTLQSMTPSSCS